MRNGRSLDSQTLQNSQLLVQEGKKLSSAENSLTHSSGLASVVYRFRSGLPSYGHDTTSSSSSNGWKSYTRSLASSMA